MEIKKNITPKDPDKNYSVLKKFEKSGFTIKPMVVVSLSKEFIPYNKNCYLCPVDLI